MPICTIPWNHIAILQNGDYGICCQCIYNSHGRLTTDGNVENINNDIDNIRNHPTYVELRKSMLAGEQHPLCKLCWDEEEYGKRSKRINQVEIYSDLAKQIEADTDKSGVIDTNKYPIQYIDLRLGNLCNLACRICGPVNSSLWQDYMDGGSFEVGDKKYNITKVGASWRIDSDDFQFYKTNAFKRLLDKVLPTTDRIYFTGGEPLINKQHYDILDYCITNNAAKDISLEYNTNGTTLNPNLLEQWKHFKKVEVCFSIDAMGELSNYIRHPSNWETIEHNIRLVSNSGIPHLIGTANCTVSMFNVMQFPEFYDWYYNQRFVNFKRTLVWNRLVFPKFLNIQNLPEHAKKNITKYYTDYIAKSNTPGIEQIYSLIDFMNSVEQDKNEFFKSFLAVKRQDKLREQTIESIPWLSELYKELTNG